MAIKPETLLAEGIYRWSSEAIAPTAFTAVERKAERLKRRATTPFFLHSRRPARGPDGGCVRGCAAREAGRLAVQPCAPPGQARAGADRAARPAAVPDINVGPSNGKRRKRP
jgi:hypothetical protein